MELKAVHASSEMRNNLLRKFRSQYVHFSSAVSCKLRATTHYEAEFEIYDNATSDSVNLARSNSPEKNTCEHKERENER
jgi:hypothetical protein